MGQLSDLQDARRRLGLALDSVCHDRWVLGYLRNGSLQPIAASEISRRFMQTRPLMPLSRRALFEKRPLVLNSVFEKPDPSNGYDWELDWPAILYTPIGEMGHRPIGLLVIGCRNDHWYTEEDVAYAHTLSYSLAPLVAALRGPLSRLNESEGEVAQLLSYGLSTQEIARAIRTDDRHARTLVSSVVKRLQSVNADDLMFPIIQMKRRAFRL
jgi:DNA-binding CsgD family transcriptional regulator